MRCKPLPGFSLAAALICATTVALAQGQAQEKFQQAQDMRYGAGLYEYFQGNHFDALSTLMVSEQRGGIRVHADNAELIEGGISLGFGLQRRAAELFERQLEKNGGDTPARYRRLAWLKLAELNYLQGDWELSAAQLEKSGADHSDLALNLALRSGDLQGAKKLLADRGLPLEQRVLGHINLGAALAREQRFAEAVDHYHRASALAAEEDEPPRELLVLKDKAHIGAGYAYGLQQRHKQAAEEFRQVRLRTPWADRALLGLGWSSINSGQYQSAIDPLQFLVERQPLSTEVQEALAALPYSYEKLRRPRAALAAYQQAEHQYQSALGELRELQESLRSLQFSPAGTDTQTQRYGWLEEAQAPELMRENLRYLRPILQRDNFQLRLSELRDLRQLIVVIDNWQQRLPLFEQLIAERRQRRSSIIEDYTSAQFDQQVDIARQQYHQLEASLAHIEKERDGLALLDKEGEKGEFLAIVEEAEARYRRLTAHGETQPRQAQTLARARGILLWQANQDYHHNLWQKRRELRKLDAQLQGADRRRGSADRIARRAPQLQTLRTKVDAARTRLRAQRQRVDAASREIEAAIRRDVIAELARQRQQIGQYLAHTRLAIARLQDAAMQAGERSGGGAGE